MKKAIQIGYDDYFEKKCQFASEGGFRHISVNFAPLMGKTESKWDCATEDILRILEENNLECVQSHPYYYDLRISSEIIEEKKEFAIKQAIRASGKIGAPWCALHPRTSISSGYADSKSFDDNRRYFFEYLEYAHKYNTGLAAENLPIFPDVIPMMPFYSYSCEDLCNLVDSFKDERVGICWDFGHAHLVNMDQKVALRDIGERLKCTHVHNNFQDNDFHLTPDQGTVPWEELMPVLNDIGYDGPLTAEIHCRYTDDDLLKSFARHSYNCLVYLEKLAKRGQ